MGLKDLFGRLFKETVKPETRELSAVSLLERWSTYPSSGLTPNRLVGNLPGGGSGQRVSADGAV